MFGLRGLARTLLASIFVVGGVNAWRRSARLAESAAPVMEPIGELTPGELRSEQLVKINAGIQVVGGVLLALGIVPRVMAVVLGGSLVPTTLAGHRFWEIDDDTERIQQRTHFLKNAGLLGGLVFVALDTGGRPSIFWTGRRFAGEVAGTLSDVADTITSTTDSVSSAIAR